LVVARLGVGGFVSGSVVCESYSQFCVLVDGVS
jgi:hypothetical protein